MPVRSLYSRPEVTTPVSTGITGATGSWYLVHCKPRHEELAVRVLCSQLDLHVYLPEVLHRVRGATQRVPFFPGYLFAQVNLSEVQLSSINAAPGVIRLLDFGGEPQQVPTALVYGIQQRLEALNSSGTFPILNLSPGDTVRFKTGAWRGMEAIFLGPTTPSTRVRVLLDLLGRQNEVKVEVGDLERVQREQPDRHARSARGTRGGGRKINRASQDSERRA